MFPFDQQSETRAGLLKLMEIALEDATRGVLPIALRLELRDIVSLLVYQAYQSRHEGEPEQKAISDTAEDLTNLLNKLTRRKRGNDLKTVDSILNLPEAAKNILLMDIALALGWRLGGARLAILCSAMVLAIASLGLWEKAMISVYLVGASVFLACLIGIPIGILSARNDRLHSIVQVIIDTLQTLPAFVYLIPVIMLFSVGDFSAMVAVVLYSVVPAIRYTDHGIRSIRADMIEAPVMMGCSRLQIIRRVQLPLALPDIMLGVNQTLMMALSMLVITALVGTRDLGQETLIALSKVDPGRGLVAGICVAFIAITADRLITAWANKRKQELGLS